MRIGVPSSWDLVKASLCVAAAVAALIGTSVHGRAAAGPTVEDTKAFIDQAERELMDLSIKAARASWVMSTYITEDTEVLAAEADPTHTAARLKPAARAALFEGLAVPPDLARRLKLLRTSMSLAAPSDPGKQAELSQITASMESRYGKGQYCRPGGECLDINKITRILAESRDPNELQELWVGWHAIAPPMRPQYKRFVELANEGAKELAFDDLGAL